MMKIAGIKTVLLLIACFFIVCFTSKAQSTFEKIDSEVKNPKLKEFNMQDKGWWCAVEIHAGMVWYRPKTYEGLWGLTFTNGYRFSEYFRLGVGFGVSILQYDYNYVGQFPYKIFTLEVPFFMNMRGNLFSQKERKCVPFWNVDIGYLIVRKFMFDVGIGIRAGGIRNNFVLSVNYIGRMVEPHYNQESKFSNGILMKLGYEF